MKVAIILFLGLLNSSFGEVKIDAMAPGFTLKSASGKEIKLSDFRGKVVALEWLNYGCPFVKKHYKANNMQKLQEKYTSEGVVWLSVISSAKGEQGYSSPDKALQDKGEHKSKATHVLLDVDGEVGKAYGAKVTPHMYVVDKKGVLVYQGGIDSIASTDVKDIKLATPFMDNALNAAVEGEEIKIKESKPYGCSVKY